MWSRLVYFVKVGSIFQIRGSVICVNVLSILFIYTTGLYSVFMHFYIHIYIYTVYMQYVCVCVLGHPRELTEEEKQQVLHSEEFVIFFDRSIRVMERALAEDSNIFFDYSGRDLEDKEG